MKSSQFQLFLKVLFAVLAAAFISSLKLDFIESYLYDIRFRIISAVGLAQLDNPKVTLLLVDAKAIEKYKGFPNYVDHAEILEKLYQHNPAFIVYDFRISDKRELINIPGSLDEKHAFVSTAKKFENFHIAADELNMKNEAIKLSVAPPLDVLNYSPGTKNPDGAILARDGVYRRVMISYQEQPLLHTTVAGYYSPLVKDTKNIQGAFDFYDSVQAYIHFHPAGSFPRFSFVDLQENKIPPEYLKDRIIIVGTDTGISSKEYAITPYSREVTAMTSAELHANSFQTLIDNNGLIKVPNVFNIALTLIISLFTVYVALALKPAKGLILIGIALFASAFLGTSLMLFFDIWIDLAHPFLAIFLCYYFFIPYRLIIENRKSWEYFQKNKLLQQVEELKTNFISMMSHDLKTPIARIQGMTEVILKDEIPLSATQREAVDTIKASSDDLLKFINSILQYGRIESQGVELNRKSKDVNQLLKDVIQKHEFLAKVKKIKIQSELEPLFPISLDSDLMKQVFSNLVENAIKYSHENSVVTIKSREEGEYILIEVSDQGVGIPSVDLPNIFMKFFRSHNVKTSTIKGTGLGLYLAQYFVQLHKGEIKVTSEPEKGSCFTVCLPLNS